MRLTGNMKMELTDVNTGEVVTIAEENMVTKAVNNILGLNPMGVFYEAGDSIDGIEWHGSLLPICPNMIGGILLFSQSLPEETDYIYAGSNNLPVAYASNNVNSTANLARGSMNLTESKALENGYKFVWEFTPSQGNGTIAAAALTSAQGGANGYGSLVNDSSTFLQQKASGWMACPRQNRWYCLRRWRWILKRTCCIPLRFRTLGSASARCRFLFLV